MRPEIALPAAALIQSATGDRLFGGGKVAARGQLVVGSGRAEGQERVDGRNVVSEDS